MEQPELWAHKTFCPLTRINESGKHPEEILEYGWIEVSDVKAKKTIIYIGLILVDQPVTEKTERIYLISPKAATQRGWRVDH